MSYRCAMFNVWTVRIKDVINIFKEVWEVSWVQIAYYSIKDKGRFRQIWTQAVSFFFGGVGVGWRLGGSSVDSDGLNCSNMFSVHVAPKLWSQLLFRLEFSQSTSIIFMERVQCLAMTLPRWSIYMPLIEVKYTFFKYKI